VANAADINFASSVAEQYGRHGVRINTVNPGPVDTGYAPPDVHEAVRRRFPQARWGDPDDPARLIAWLATDEAAWITGQVINTEGGFRRQDQ
jgi:3-oxoacyl-[acyl-carrier protein] reductase